MNQVLDMVKEIWQLNCWQVLAIAFIDDWIVLLKFWWLAVIVIIAVIIFLLVY